MGKKHLVFLIFPAALILFAFFANKLGFHDSYEYITVAKSLYGIRNLGIFSAHPLLYPAILSLFLKIWPSLKMIQLVNVLWIYLISLSLFFLTKDWKLLLLFIFSPLVWITGVQTTPILPASFFFVLSFIFLNKEIKHNLVYSGVFLGLACAFYTPLLLVSFFFVLIFFWNKQFSSVLKYILFIFLGLMPTFLLEYYLFKNPFYSLIRYFGANFVLFAGLTAKQGGVFNYKLLILLIFLISPLLFKIYRINLRENKKTIIFLITVIFFFLIGGGQIKSFLMFTPIVLALLVKNLNKRDIKISCFLSVFLILIMTWNYFGVTEDVLVEKDLKRINEDFNATYIIAGLGQANEFAAYLWEDEPKIVWFEDFQTSLKNETVIRGYEIDTAQESKMPLKDRVIISASFNRFSNLTYEDYILVTKEGVDQEGIKDFKLKNCYEILCVYTK